METLFHSEEDRILAQDAQDELYSFHFWKNLKAVGIQSWTTSYVALLDQGV